MHDWHISIMKNIPRFPFLKCPFPVLLHIWTKKLKANKFTQPLSISVWAQCSSIHHSAFSKAASCSPVALLLLLPNFFPFCFSVPARSSRCSSRRRRSERRSTMRAFHSSRSSCPSLPASSKFSNQRELELVTAVTSSQAHSINLPAGQCFQLYVRFDCYC